jgi:imidazolonepropionase-like amidohydrolase
MIALLVPLIIAGAQVHTGDGPPKTASVLVENGRIQAVGEISPPLGTQVIAGTSLVVTAGFIDASTQLGLVEIEMIATTRDHDAEGPDSVRAAFRAVDAFNPHSSVIPIQRAHGVTTALALPTGGLIAGQGFAFDLGAEVPFLPAAAFVVQLGGREVGSRGQELAHLRAVLADARLYRKNKAAFDRNQYRQLAAHPLDLEALFPLLDGRIPLVVHAHRQADVRSTVELAAAEKLKVILAGATEAWLEAPRLAAARIPVIIDPFANLPGNFDMLQVKDDLAARLAAAGVPVILSTFSAHRVRTLRFAAGNAVRAGLPHDVALAALTTHPAAAFGLADRGRVAPGQVANLVVWSGDPFEPASQVLHVLVGGVEVPLAHRQRALFDRYRKLPATGP